jgi:hypothetical protein
MDSHLKGYEERLAERSQGFTAFLGGITFAAMVVVMQPFGSDPFKKVSWLPPGQFLDVLWYPELLIDWLAIVSVLFVFSSAFYNIMAVSKEPYARKFRRSAIGFTWAGFVGLLLLMPLILLPFSFIGALFTLSLEVMFLVFTIRHHKSGSSEEKKEKASPQKSISCSLCNRLIEAGSVCPLCYKPIVSS